MSITVQDMIVLELALNVPWPDDLPWPDRVYEAPIGVLLFRHWRWDATDLTMTFCSGSMPRPWRVHGKRDSAYFSSSESVIKELRKLLKSPAT